MLPVLFPNPQTRAAITAMFIVIGALNHQVAANSFPDGAPVTTATAKVTVAETTPAGETTKSVEVHTDTPQASK